MSELTIPLADIDILVTFGLAITDDILAEATGLEWIQSLATGVDHFLRSPALRPETILTSARGMHGPAMRETVAYLMLTLSHDTRRLMRQQAAHRWERNRRWPLLAGKTALVVGTGVSGTAVAQLLQSLGMRVIGASRTPRQAEGFDTIVETGRLAEAVGDADYLINILPGNARNAGLIGADVFSAMKPSAFFINVGRGETVDEAALIGALRDGRIAGAGLDVFSSEPLPADSPLWELPNTVICPHIGGFFAEYEDYVMPILIENLRLFLDGRQSEMRNLVPH
jgi:phosphoglycerate dehydrogenase-like enzyme